MHAERRTDDGSVRPLTGIYVYVRATVAYDGTDFRGFQWQTRGRTVQGVLEQALAQVCGIQPADAPSRVIAAGRTDAGVHARGQVVGFLTTWRHPLAELERALNAVLPEDVAVQQLEPTGEDWHPRFSAVRRTYRYTVLNRPVRSPLDRRYALHVDRPLDLAALKAGAQHLVGEHDFASFGQPMSKDGEKDGTPLQAARPSAGLTQDLRSTVAKSPWACAAGTGRTTRCIYEADWTRSAGPGGRDWLVFDVSGNAFLRGMVRNMVGSLLQVGLGLWPADRIAEVLALRERSACAAPPSGAAPAPACGLCLMQVDYE